MSAIAIMIVVDRSIIYHRRNVRMIVLNEEKKHEDNMCLTDALKMFSASVRIVKRSKTRGKRNSGATVSPLTQILDLPRVRHSGCYKYRRRFPSRRSNSYYQTPDLHMNHSR